MGSPTSPTWYQSPGGSFGRQPQCILLSCSSQELPNWSVVIITESHEKAHYVQFIQLLKVQGRVGRDKIFTSPPHFQRYPLEETVCDPSLKTTDPHNCEPRKVICTNLNTCRFASLREPYPVPNPLEAFSEQSSGQKTDQGLGP